MDFIKRMNLEIGSEFNHDGGKFKMVKDSFGCDGCYFNTSSIVCSLENTIKDSTVGCGNYGVIFEAVITPHEVPKNILSYETICSVTKITDEEILREACESTFNGKSNVDLLKMYRSEHSPIRTQLFWIKFDNLPLFVSTHLLRHNVGSQPFALTHREDLKGGEDLGRLTPTRLSMLINAQSLIDMAKVRLCKKASKETVSAFKMIKDELKWKDIDLSNLLVPKCVYRNGICGEIRPCGFNKTSTFNSEMKTYLALFE